jgi:hypothetical protein
VKVPPRPPIEDEEFEVVFSGRDSLSKFRKDEDDQAVTVDWTEFKR